jgi:hypothetical protein
LAIIGSAIGLLPKLYALAALFQPQSLLPILHHGTQVRVICPWLASVLLLAFSMIYFFNSVISRDKPIKMAFAAGAAGWFIMAAIQSLVMINFLTDGRRVWLAELFSVGPSVFVIASSLTFLGLGIFYLSFTRRP